MVNTQQIEVLPNKKQTVFGACSCILLYLLARENYLFFHTVAEFTRIVVSVLVYILATKTYRFSRDNYLHFLGVAFLFLAVLNFFHLITYYGMGIFPELSRNRATQFWIASQYLKSLSLLAAAIIAQRQLSRNVLMIIFGVITIGLTLLMLPFHLFPICYIPRVGLSKFKIFSEYLISLTFVASLITMYIRRSSISIYVCRAVILSIVLNIASELMFTLYFDVYGVINFIGHILQIIADFFIYQGIVSQGLVAPYKTIFHRLQDTNESLLKVNTYKSVFLATVGHELRTPLTGILGLSEELLSEKHGQLNHLQKDYLEDIYTGGKMLLRLIDNLLDLTKIESGKESLSLSEVQVAQILDEEVKRLRGISSRKNIKIMVSSEKTSIFADEDKMRQVIRNLLVNAIKFSPMNGELAVSLSTTETPEEGILCEFKDFGIGIREEEQSKIFETFYQVDKGLNRRYPGTGLGLALVKKIVDLHKGSVWVDSQIGKGSTFHVYLPKYPLIDTELKH